MFENLAALNECREKLLMLSDGWAVLDNNGDLPESRASALHLIGGLGPPMGRMTSRGAVRTGGLKDHPPIDANIFLGPPDSFGQR